MPPAAPRRVTSSHWRKTLILRTKKPFFTGPAVTRDLSAQPAVLIGLIAHVVGTCHDQAWQRARSRRTRFTCDAASRAPASLIRARGSGGSAKRSSTSSMRASTCGRHHMSLHEGLSWISAKRRRRRDMLACGVRPTPKSSSVQRAASRGRARTGALQAERRRMKKVGNILELSATDLSATSTAVSERSSTAWRGGDGTRFCSSRYKVRRWNEGRQIARQGAVA